MSQPFPVIIFGAALKEDGTAGAILVRRVAAALRFGQHATTRPLYIPTGGVPRAGRTEADVMAALLRDAGVPGDAILAEPVASDTCDSVIICTKILRARGYAGPVGVATSDFHMMRCVAMMRAMGWSVVTIPSPAGTGLPVGALLWQWLREVPATVWDVFLVLLWRLRHPKR
ncbi:ElyC/SanA/YdcF family protein [Acetobacter fallax]|uniref:YdcF family protein n=1 Tax=Acetobacter fallax TaxID=1737473 RepID=A0ABX0K8N6_9PROT|nr:YdcF family protein [Acetobacter fallax]NHO36315.1 YdcF family protein [Acetobacter fallax]